VQSEIRHTIARVASSKTRLRALAGGGVEGAVDLFDFLRRIVPKAERALFQIRRLAEAIPDDRLREQALNSIRSKAYHVAGGCILATFL
jgi:hypothetical protein